jgi:hypothetical protein
MENTKTTTTAAENATVQPAIATFQSATAIAQNAETTVAADSTAQTAIRLQTTIQD